MTTFSRKIVAGPLSLPLIAALSLLPTSAAIAAAQSKKLPVAFKWERYEIKLKSSKRYTNPIQQATLDAYFVSPEGQTNHVLGFWDGGREWRVRFSPDSSGRWKYFTRCTDEENKGLHNQSGEFVCTAATGKTRLGRHGPVQVARGQRHLEHADHEPFLWLGDVAQEGARRSGLVDWEYYARIRSAQNFNATLWSVVPGKDFKGETSFTGGDLISINVDFFKRLDAKVETLNRAGLLSAIAPIWEIGAGANDSLPEDQAVKLLRYIVARWGGDDVAWVLAFETEADGARLARWKRVGREVFSDIAHAPVVLFPNEATWAFDEFRDEQWVDVFAFNTAQASDESALPWLLNGPLTLERRKEPARPLITLLPPSESSSGGKTVNREQARRLLWWSMLVNSPAGVTYATPDISEWKTNKPATTANSPALPAWNRALILPGAYDITSLQLCFKNVAFWRLRPFPRAVAEQPGDISPNHFIAAAGTEDRDLTVIYSPASSIVGVQVAAIPSTASTTWFNPRSGQSSPALGATQGNVCQFATPGPGDWLLVMKTAKPSVAAK